MQQITIERQRPVLGTFGKALPGSVSLNYGLSGGTNCDRSCRLHPDSTAPDALPRCYAARSEIRPDRTQLRDKLARHEDTNPGEITSRAITELAKRTHVPWLRVSTNGSLPHTIGRPFARQLRRLLEIARDRGIPIHIPVECASKRRAYQRAIGDRAIVRETCQTIARFLFTRFACSFVAGNPGMSRRERIAEAKRVARMRRERSGRRTIVCPAVAASFTARDRKLSGDAYVNATKRAKCGACVACAMPDTDIVYPLH